MSVDLFKAFVAAAAKAGATDFHIRYGSPARIRIGGRLTEDSKISFDGRNLKKVAAAMLTDVEKQSFTTNKTVKGVVALDRDVKMRYHFGYDRGQLYLTGRLYPSTIRTWEMLNIPSLALKFLEKKQGLILISGPLNSGKTSTLVSFTDYINQTRPEHIIFVDELIEHKIKSKQSIVNLRQLKTDTASYTTALKYALREDPDIIVIGDINNAESAEIAMNIAETGHLVIGCVSTVGALNTIQRILNCFPATQLEGARMKLAAYLIGILSQIMVPDAKSMGMVPIFEVMTITESVANNIRSDKTNQLKAEFSRSVKGVSLCFEDSAKQAKTSGLIPADLFLDHYLLT